MNLNKVIMYSTNHSSGVCSSLTAGLRALLLLLLLFLCQVIQRFGFRAANMELDMWDTRMETGQLCYTLRQLQYNKQTSMHVFVYVHACMRTCMCVNTRLDSP